VRPVDLQWYRRPTYLDPNSPAHVDTGSGTLAVLAVLAVPSWHCRSFLGMLLHLSFFRLVQVRVTGLIGTPTTKVRRWGGFMVVSLRFFFLALWRPMSRSSA
jgi:hypothetical protein